MPRLEEHACGHTPLVWSGNQELFQFSAFGVFPWTHDPLSVLQDTLFSPVGAPLGCDRCLEFPALFSARSVTQTLLTAPEAQGTACI